MILIDKIVHRYPVETYQARLDEARVTNNPLVERPYYYQHKETGQQFYDLFGCIGYPTEVSDKDEGRAGYCAVIGVVKNSGEPQEAPFQLLEERQSKDIPTLFDHLIDLRQRYGFGLSPGLMQGWYGDPTRFITALALLNEKMAVKGGERSAILIYPPVDFYEPKSFDHYVRTLHSVVVPGKIRLYFGRAGQNEILKQRIREFLRDDPAVFAVGGLIHTLTLSCLWMDQARENAFTVGGDENEKR